MCASLISDQLRRLRLAHQGLAAKDRFDSAGAAVKRLCALQSQEWPSAQLAIAARTQDLTVGDVRRAREIDRAFVLTWSLRGTLHLVDRGDLGWQLALFGKRAISATRSRYHQLGLTETVRERALDAIAEVLANGSPLTRAELAAELAAYDIPVQGQAIHHLVRFAAYARSRLSWARARWRFDLSSYWMSGCPIFTWLMLRMRCRSWRGAT